jgi:hypothetical protein
MQSPTSKLFEKINKLRTVSQAALKKLYARLELILMDTDVVAIDKYTKNDIREKIVAIKNCSTILEIRKYDNDETRLHNANFCKNPIVCPICAARTSNKRRAIYLPAVSLAVDRYVVTEKQRQEKLYPSGYTGAYLGTATIPPGLKLEERINFLSESMKKFRKMGQKREKCQSGGESGKIKAALSNIEIKIGTGSGQWHTHAHYLMFTNEPLDTKIYDSNYKIEIDDKDNPGQKKTITLSKIQYEWYLATGCTAFNFHVQPIQFKEFVGNVHCESVAQSIMLQSAEVFKYNTKLTEENSLIGLSDRQYIELIQRRGGRRLFNATGEFRCDHRNPKSLMTIKDREIRRQEYVDKYDSMTYNIFSSEYSEYRFGYSNPKQEESAVFKSSDDIMCKFKDLRKYAFTSAQAKMTAKNRVFRNDETKKIREFDYSSQKTGFLNYNDILDAFESFLDNNKKQFRNNSKEFWRNYNKNNVQVHIYNDENVKVKKYLILKEDKSKTGLNPEDFLQDGFAKYSSEHIILATNMTAEEIDLHKKAAKTAYTIV